ncbi:hypothetical protein ABIE44_003437 [Marmoricola sp. OAE513]|uniref:LppX_LprAFG lipoprotein n=1 Tax=Marmoricola sp. OAE513 TaxID=2817894 RepID=UPI001AE7B108
MTRTRTRLVAAAASGVLLLAPLAGCGGDDKKKDATSSSASDKGGNDAASAGADDADQFTADLVAAMNKQKSVHMTIEGGLTAEADMKLGADPVIKLNASMGAGKLEMILADNAMYMLQAPGTKYRKIGKDDPTFGSLLGTFNGLSPSQAVTGIKGGITKFKKVGEKTVDGQKVTQYDVTADTSKVDGAFTALAGASGPVEMKFFVGEGDLLQQIQLDLSGQKLALKFSDWNKPVDIKIPTGDQLLN